MSYFWIYRPTLGNCVSSAGRFITPIMSRLVAPRRSGFFGRRIALDPLDGSLLANRCGIRVAFSGINFLAEHESIRYNAVHYGYSFDYSCRSCRWRNREAIDAGERSWWFYRHDSARHRWRVHRHLPRPSPRLVQGRTTSGLDHVDHWCHDPVAALSVAFQAPPVAFRYRGEG